MVKFLWLLLILFVLGNAFFVLPVHFSKETFNNSYSANFKKDSDLLRAVFPDSNIHLQVNMPVEYRQFYTDSSGTSSKTGNKQFIVVNVSVSNNLDFASLLFPFYKLVNYNGIIAFYSIIRVDNAPDRDSTVLIGNIAVKGKLSVAGICTPLYVRSLVEKDLVNTFQKQMALVETDLNKRPLPDTTAVFNAPVLAPKHVKKRRA